MTTSTTLFSPTTLGPNQLRNRLVMAPMTRSRAGAGNVPAPIAATYYAQRSTAGLIVTEATQVSPTGVGYPNTPGIHSPEQVAGWRRVTDAVHAAGGVIYLQLWHVGRISHPSFQPGGALPVAPSAVAAAGMIHTPQGPQPFPVPRALELDEIPEIIEQFRRGAENALRAGFDGVEVHGANGYLIDQFLRDGTNTRTDAYGGSLENRIRFALEVTQAVAAVWGANRVGFRISPSGTFNDMRDSNPAATFGSLAAALSSIGIGYLHVVRAQEADLAHGAVEVPVSQLRSKFRQLLIANGAYSPAEAENALATGEADLIAFGKLFLSNPDLPRRIREKLVLNAPDPGTFYGGTEVGYTDYPYVEGVKAA